MLTLFLRSAAMAIIPVGLFFAVCSYLSFHPSLGAWLPLVEPIARGAYFGRLVPIQLRPDCAHYDPRVTYLLRPGGCRFSEAGFDTRVSINSVGLRDDEDSLVAPQVIVLGDSHAMGHGVEDDETFPAVLERRLGRNVLNAGISSFGTARELILLHLLDTSAARVIVIQYCENDLDENLALKADGTLPIRPEARYRRLVERASAPYRPWLMPGFGALERIASRVGRIAGVARDPNAVDAHAEAFARAIAQSAPLLRGKKIIVLELNGRGRTLPGLLEKARQRLAPLGLDIAFLDVSTALQPADFLPLDGHMRPSGHEKVAALLEAAIDDD